MTSPDDLKSMLTNPFYTITINPVYAEPHVPLVSKKDWIAANVQMINEEGPEVYLRRLLTILEA